MKRAMDIAMFNDYCLSGNSSGYAKNTWLRLFVVWCAVFFPLGNLYAQTDLSSDELFQMAKQVAFENKDYPKAISLSLDALSKSPGYSDLRVFLGRLYTWSGEYHNAKDEFLKVLEYNPDFEDATLAIVDLEYWNNHYDSALSFCNEGLVYHPVSEDLLFRKAKILNGLQKYKDAWDVASALLESQPKNENLRSLLQSIRFDSAKNKISISHDFSWFDQNYPDYLHKYPWHIIGFDFSRYTSIGSVAARLNYGNRFESHAFQFEMDAYPHISKNLMGYVNVGLSDKSAVFPQYRAGMSLYVSLPHSFEFESGFRFLHFSSTTWIYVGSIAKYYRNFWFNGRVYLVPGNEKISHSYSLLTRYYFGGSDDYIKANVGYGLSPDDDDLSQSFSSNYRLLSRNFSVGIRKCIARFNVVGISISIANQEYNENKYGNTISSGITYIRKF